MRTPNQSLPGSTCATCAMCSMWFGGRRRVVQVGTCTAGSARCSVLHMLRGTAQPVVSGATTFCPMCHNLLPVFFSFAEPSSARSELEPRGWGGVGSGRAAPVAAVNGLALRPIFSAFFLGLGSATRRGTARTTRKQLIGRRNGLGGLSRCHAQNVWPSGRLLWAAVSASSTAAAPHRRRPKRRGKPFGARNHVVRAPLGALPFAFVTTATGKGGSEASSRRAALPSGPLGASPLVLPAARPRG